MEFMQQVMKDKSNKAVYINLKLGLLKNIEPCKVPVYSIVTPCSSNKPQAIKISEQTKIALADMLFENSSCLYTCEIPYDVLSRIIESARILTVSDMAKKMELAEYYNHIVPQLFKDYCLNFGVVITDYMKKNVLEGLKRVDKDAIRQDNTSSLFSLEPITEIELLEVVLNAEGDEYVNFSNLEVFEKVQKLRLKKTSSIRRSNQGGIFDPTLITTSRLNGF